MKIIKPSVVCRLPVLRVTTLVPFFLFGSLSPAGFAQELVPAAYTPAPVGINLLAFSGGLSSGDISFDPSLPVEDVRARIHAWSVSYGRTFGVFGRAANVTVIAPYLVGRIEGLYTGEQTVVERSGIADAVLRFGVNLVGAPAMTLQEFAGYRPRTLFGASLLVRVPTGEYDSSKLINIGSNRWGFKPEVGIVHVMGKWALDAYVGAWLFTDNPNFYGGNTRAQDPILSTQAHIRYFVNPRWWAAVDGNFWYGGQTAGGGVAKDDLQRNSRVGLTVAWQAAPRHGVRFLASRGAVTRIGGDFTSIGLTYSFTWM